MAVFKRSQDRRECECRRAAWGKVSCRGFFHFLYFVPSGPARSLPAEPCRTPQNPQQALSSPFWFCNLFSIPANRKRQRPQTTLFLATFQQLTPNAPRFSLICTRHLQGLPRELLGSGSTGRRSSVLGPALSWGCWLCHVDGSVGVSTGRSREGGGRAIRSKVPPKPEARSP